MISYHLRIHLRWIHWRHFQRFELNLSQIVFVTIIYFALLLWQWKVVALKETFMFLLVTYFSILLACYDLIVLFSLHDFFTFWTIQFAMHYIHKYRLPEETHVKTIYSLGPNVHHIYHYLLVSWHPSSRFFPVQFYQFVFLNVVPYQLPTWLCSRSLAALKLSFF